MMPYNSNFARCCLVVIEIFSEILRTLLQDASSSGQQIYDLIIKNNSFKKKLKQSEWNAIQRLVTDDFSLFDVSLTYKVVRYFKCLEQPTRDWGANPTPTEISVGDDVERIKNVRNKFVHKVDCEYTETEMNNFFDEFIGVTERLDKVLKSSFKSKIEHVRTCSFTEHDEKKYIDAVKEIEKLRDGVEYDHSDDEANMQLVYPTSNTLLLDIDVRSTVLKDENTFKDKMTDFMQTLLMKTNGKETLKASDTNVILEINRELQNTTVSMDVLNSATEAELQPTKLELVDTNSLELLKSYKTERPMNSSAISTSVEHVREQMNVQDIDKTISSVFKGVDRKSDAMFLMSTESNWDRFLTRAPFAIALLGDLILISADTDFTLHEKPPRDGFKLLRYPDSFRASLVQVSNAGWSAFNEAHYNMDQIRLHSGNVDGHVKNAVRILMQGTPEDVKNMLPMSLNNVRNNADASLKLATEIEHKFIEVMELTGELLEAYTNTKGVYDEKVRDTKIAIQVAKTENKRGAKEVAESLSRLVKMEFQIKKAQEDFKDSIKSVSTSLRMDMLDIAEDEALDLIEGVRGITSISSMVKGAVKRKFKEESDDEDDTQDETEYNKQMSKLHVFSEVSAIKRKVGRIVTIVSGNINEKNEPCPDWGKIIHGELDYVQRSIENSKSKIIKENNSDDLRQKVLKLCDEAISVCILSIRLSQNTTTDDRENQVLEAIRRAKALQQEVQILDVQASKFLGKNPLDNKSPHLSKMPTNSESEIAVKTATENARYKLELAKETMKDAKRRQEQSYNELKESNEKLTHVLMDMAKLDLKKIDFDTIRETLIKGIKALAEVREQWGKLVRFFQMLSNLMECCLHTTLTDFVDQAEKGEETKMEDHSIPLTSNIFRDVIFEQALKASQVAYVVRTISGTYVQISNDHLMDRITCLGRLVALDPKKDEHEITIRRQELHNGCAEAQEAIADIVRKQQEEFHYKIDERLAQISEIENKLPSIEPQCVQKIKASVEMGMKMSDEELDYLV